MANIQHPADLDASRACKPLSILGTALCFFALATLTQTSVQAQTLYRIVGPDGRITFSDKPPTTPAKVTELSADGANVSASTAALPYELRRVANKYPVTLFTSKECAPCDEGRTMLRSRGIPFAEKTINTNEDAESLKRLADTSSLPLLTVGGQQIKGYSAPEWTQYLNAAGYPERSSLPANYRYAEPSPLVTLKAPAASAAPAESAAPSSRTPATAIPSPRTNPDNPAGIQF